MVKKNGIEMHLQSPFTAIISGATGTGKSEWIMKLIRNANKMINEPPKHIMYCYSEINAQILRLKSLNIEIYHGVPTKDEIMEKPKNLLLILDDLVSEIDGNYLETLYTKGSHHWDVSVITVTQNLYVPAHIKMARVNCHYLIVMKNPQGLLQIRTLASQLFAGGKSKYFLEAYKDAVEQQPYGYLFINMKPNTDEKYRLCTNIFPNQTPIIYLPI